MQRSARSPPPHRFAPVGSRTVRQPFYDEGRTKAMFTLRSLLVAILLAGGWLGLGGPVYAGDAGIEGLWSLEDVIFDACPTGNPVRTVFDLKMFLHDGSMIETSGTPGVGAPPLQRGTPGLGS